ncbi:hypothetical protein LINGRAHAP2_LOCUS892 [Linum grandiflorum]
MEGLGSAISFSCTSSEIVPTGNYFGMSNCTSTSSMGVTMAACNSPGSSSLLLESGPSFKHDTGLAVDWSVEEQYRLEEGLQKYSDEPSIMRYVKIAATLPDKTVRDVALRCRWMTVSESEENLMNTMLAERSTIESISIQDKLLESSSKMNMSSPLGQNLSVYPVMMQNVNQTGSLPFQGISGTSRHLLEQNIEAFSQISANISAFKFEDNIDLFCRTRNNITAILNDMSEMPGIMSHMPPLPVSVNDDLANSFLPSTTQSMMFGLPSGMQLKQEPRC